METHRQRIIDLLRQGYRTALELSRMAGIPEKEVYRHLEHIVQTVSARGEAVVVTPCTCQGCGFSFTRRRRLTRPGRCPRCRQTRIDHPVFHITAGKRRRMGPPNAIQDD